MGNVAETLGPKEVLLLWVLLFTGAEPKISELRPNIGVDRRKKLERLGLIALEKRYSPSKSGRKYPAQHVTLTDKAWLWATEHLDAEFSRTSNAAPALHGLLLKLKAYLAANDMPLAALLSAGNKQRLNDDVSSVAEPVDETIVAAYLALTHGKWHVRVRLAELRPRLAHIDRKRLDEALLRMQREDRLVLYPNDDSFDMTHEDEDAALYVGANPRHILYMRG